MVIELYDDVLVKDMKTKSHYEVSEIPDAEARYRAEAGTEKEGEIHKCINEGASRLMHRCLRFLRNYYVDKRDNEEDPKTAYTYDFVLSERRSLGKAEPLAEAMNTFVVEYALSKFYATVSQGDLSNKHSLLAVDAGNRIDELLYYKLPPRV